MVGDTPTIPFETTLEVRDNCLCMHVQRAARALARRFDDALKPSGINNGQFSLLMSLNRPQPPLMRDVATLLSMDRTTLTAALKPLERRGLVRAVSDETDRRGKRLTLTDEGRAALTEALPAWRRTQAEVSATLGEPDRLRAELVSLG